jgi:hypothetical protein
MLQTSTALKKMQQKLENVMAFHQFHGCRALWLQGVFCEIYRVETGLCTDYIYDQSCYLMLYCIENAILVIVTTNKVFQKIINMVHLIIVLLTLKNR